MSYGPVQDRLTAGRRVILDGGVGTELERRGAVMDPQAWCGAASADNAALLKAIHTDYIDAGAEVVTANTYASSRIMLTAAGMAARTGEINRIAVDAAQRARNNRRTVDGAPIALAGSLSHAAPVTPGTDRTDRGRLPSDAQFEDALSELALILKDAGCDLLVLEMLYDPERIPPSSRRRKARACRPGPASPPAAARTAKSSASTAAGTSVSTPSSPPSTASTSPPPASCTRPPTSPPTPWRWCARTSTAPSPPIRIRVISRCPTGSSRTSSRPPPWPISPAAGRPIRAHRS